MLAYYMMTPKKHPYASNNHQGVEHNIVSDNSDLSSLTDTVAVDFIRPMLSATPTERPSAECLRK